MQRFKIIDLHRYQLVPEDGLLRVSSPTYRRIKMAGCTSQPTCIYMTHHPDELGLLVAKVDGQFELEVSVQGETLLRFDNAGGQVVFQDFARDQSLQLVADKFTSETPAQKAETEFDKIKHMLLANDRRRRLEEIARKRATDVATLREQIRRENEQAEVIDDAHGKLPADQGSDSGQQTSEPAVPETGAAAE